MGDRDGKAGASPARPQRWNMYALAAALLASMTSILMGYNIGVMSGAGMFIEADLAIGDTKLEIVTGIINLYALLGSAVAGRMSDCLGRRLTIVFAAAVFFAGALTTALSPNYAVLMAGRLLAGIGVGYAMVIAPVYAAEIAPASARGFLSSLPDVFVNVGILLGYVSNLAFSGLATHLGWRVMYAAGAVPPAFLAVAVMAMPESPRWLVMQGRMGEAREVLGRTSESPEEAELRLAEIQEAAGAGDGVLPAPNNDKDRSAPLLGKAAGGGGGGVWRELILTPTRQVRRVLIAAVGLQFFQQATGIDSIALYCPRVFEKAGLTSDTVLLGATVAMGVVKTGAILVSVFFSDKVGRRPLLLCSTGGMVVSLLVLSSGLLLIDGRPEQRWVAGVCIAAVVGFVTSFSIGLGPVAWVYTSEIFPLRLRAQGASLAVGMNRIMSGVVTMTFLSLCKAITIYGAFYLFAGVSAAAWLFVYFRLPETRGRSLEDMQVLFGGADRHDRGEDERKEALC